MDTRLWMDLINKWVEKDPVPFPCLASQWGIAVVRLPLYENSPHTQNSLYHPNSTTQWPRSPLSTLATQCQLSSLLPQKLFPAPPRHFHNHFIRAMWSDSHTKRKTLAPIWTAKALPERRGCFGQIRGFGRTATVESGENSTLLHASPLIITAPVRRAVFLFLDFILLFIPAFILWTGWHGFISLY